MTPTTPPPSNITEWGWEWIKWISGFFDFIIKFYNEVFGVSTEWTALTLSNSWVDFGGSLETAQYRKHLGGIVQLKGTIKDGTITAGTVITTLPAGFRPLKERRFSVSTDLTRGGEARVHSDGTLTIEVGTAAYYSLDHITFQAGQ